MPGFEDRKAMAFIDTETTGLDPVQHEIWEIGLILPTIDGDQEWRWLLPVDLDRADPEGLWISGFHKRHPQGNEYDGLPDFDLTSIAPAMNALWSLTQGVHLTGAVVSFDEKRLERLMRSVGMMPAWHYHLCDVENLAAGWLMGLAGSGYHYDISPEEMRRVARAPWDSEELSRAVGVEPNDFDRHTALGDARWARAMFDACMSYD